MAENPLLKLLKVSKKEKQQAKSEDFTKRLLAKTTFNTSGKISKSAQKRKNRREKEQIKMDAILTSLPEVKAEPRKTTVFHPSANPKNLPNPQKHTGHTKLLQAENKRFSLVLQNDQFTKSPFAALRDAISQNMK